MATEFSPTRSAFLELSAERALVREGHDFLDERRIILANRILQQVRDYETLWNRYLALHRKACQALTQAVSRHGMDGLTVYPAAQLASARLETRRAPFIGMTLLETRLEMKFEALTHSPVYPSYEAEDCRRRFGKLLHCAAELGALSGNLRRLNIEYVRAERRARALENVLLPEIDSDLKFIEEQLEALEQEDAIRVRQAHRQNESRGTQRETTE